MPVVHLVAGRASRTPSTSVSTCALKKQINCSIFG
jgi:hypothetical protein